GTSQNSSPTPSRTCSPEKRTICEVAQGLSPRRHSGTGVLPSLSQLPLPQSSGTHAASAPASSHTRGGTAASTTSTDVDVPPASDLLSSRDESATPPSSAAASPTTVAASLRPSVASIVCVSPLP